MLRVPIITEDYRVDVFYYYDVMHARSWPGAKHVPWSMLNGTVRDNTVTTLAHTCIVHTRDGEGDGVVATDPAPRSFLTEFSTTHLVYWTKALNS